MTKRTYCLLNPNAAGPNILVDESNLQFTTKADTLDGNRMLLGDLVAMSGEYRYEVYFWSTSRTSLAGLVSFGVAQPDANLAKFVGGDSKSYGYRFADGQVWNNNASLATVVTQAERVCLGVILTLSPTSCTCEFTMNGNTLYTATLPNGKQWLPAFSIGGAISGDLNGVVNFGGNNVRFHHFPANTGWSQQAPGLATFYIALATEAFMTSPADSPASQHYSPLLLQAKQFSIKRMPQAWFHRTGGRSNPAAISTLRMDNSKGTFNALLAADAKDSPVILQVADASNTAGSLSAAVKVFTGILDSAAMQDSSTITITLRDTLQRFDKPTPCRFIPPFYDESAAGRIYPIGLGAQRLVDPILLSTADRLYVLGDAPMSNVAAVSDMAAPLDPNANPPQYTPALDNAGFTLQTDPVGRVAADISSVGQQYITPGVSDVLGGSGAFPGTWTGTNGAPTGWTFSNSVGSSVARTTVTGFAGGFGANIVTHTPFAPAFGKYGDHISLDVPTLIGNSVYRLTFSVFNSYHDAPDTGGQNIPGGVMVTSALSANPRDYFTGITPLQGGIVTGQNYTFEMRVPAGATRKIYIILAASSGFSPGSSNGFANAVVYNVKFELIGQFTTAPLSGIKVEDAFTEMLINREGEAAGIFSNADAQAIDAVTGYPLGFRYIDQPNTLDSLTEFADQVGAVVFTDAGGNIRIRRLTANTDGAVVASFSEANVDSESFTAGPDVAPSLTTLYGARHNEAPFGDSDFVTDTTVVTTAIRQQYKGTSQFPISSTVRPAQEYAHAIGAGRNHTRIDTAAATLTEGNRVIGLFKDKHVTRTFTAYYDGLSLGLGPSIAPQSLFYNDKITLSIQKFGWINERMTVIGTELFPGANKIIITVRH